MAHFRAIVKGRSGGIASRLGTKSTGIEARADGWHAGVRVSAYNSSKSGEDTFNIGATRGSKTETDTPFARVRETENGPLCEILVNGEWISMARIEHMFGASV